MNETINIILQSITQVGFPIVITAWLLWERKTTIDKLTETIANNTKAFELLKDEIQDIREHIKGV